MGVIQNAINQMIGTAGLAARLSPGYDTRQELHQLSKQEKALSLQKKALPNISPEEYEAGESVHARQIQELTSKQADVAQRQFELKPSKENMRKAAFARSTVTNEPLMTFQADPDEIRMEQANLKAAQKSETRQKTRRNFMDYLRNIEIQGGGKVGDLPQSIQKKIAAQYPKKDRQSIMNQMDKEKKDGNK